MALRVTPVIMSDEFKTSCTGAAGRRRLLLLLLVLGFAGSQVALLHWHYPDGLGQFRVMATAAATRSKLTNFFLRDSKLGISEGETHDFTGEGEKDMLYPGEKRLSDLNMYPEDYVSEDKNNESPLKEEHVKL